MGLAMPRFALARKMLAVLRDERLRLGARPVIPELGYDSWRDDNATIGEMCLALLVSLRHEIERNLIWLAARSGRAGAPLSRDEYFGSVRKISKLGGKLYPTLEKRLGLTEIPVWKKELDLLRLLTNCFKHDPFGQPEQADKVKGLRQKLGLRATNYAPLAESQGVVDALNRDLGVADHGDWIEIAGKFIAVSENFLDEVALRAGLQPVDTHPAPFLPEDLAH